MKGFIFDIQRFSIHDGPGIRTTVFLKGCSVRCQWCHNPESFQIKPQLQYYKDRCTGCGKCVHLCPHNVHTISKEPGTESGITHLLDRKNCTACGICATECFSNALVISGREESADEVLRQVFDDKPYYEESGGGVTLSGGEAVLQGDFCEELLKKCKDNGIHTNLQTAGFYSFELLDRLLPYLDLVMYDIKGISPQIFEHVHGDSALALKNLRLLDKKNIPIIVRMPCMKGINDSINEIEAVINFISSLKNLEYFTFLPYHSLAKVKYDVLGMEYKTFETPSKEYMEMLNGIAARYVKTG